MATVNIVRVPGDYQILAKNGGIVLDASNTPTSYSANPGSVTIYGNLDVIGTTTTVESTNTNITDNIVFLNSGETNSYVTYGLAGLAISRGSISTTTNAATLFFNDTKTWRYDNVTNHRGIWEISNEDTPSAIRVNAVRVGSAQNFLNFLGQENSNAVLNVRGTTDYENQVLDDDDIPNKKYVDTAAVRVGIDTTKKIQVGGSFVKIGDNTVAPSDPYYSLSNKIYAALTTATNIVFKLEGASALVQGLTIDDTNIDVNAGRSSNSIRLTPFSTGTVQIQSPLSLANVTKPQIIPDFTQVYSTSTVGGGGTGLYFVNTARQDELVSRRRAIIYGIIF
jgi:hypothetical protein